MNLKKYLNRDKKMSQIPQLQAKILNEIGVVYKSSTNRFFPSRIAFQLSTLILVMSGVLLIGFQEVNQDIYAFESYDEVMVTASSVAYIYYDLYQSEEEVNTLTHQDVLLGEFPYMIQYFRMFESILETQKAYALSKVYMDDETVYRYELKDMTSMVRQMEMSIKKNMITNRKDEFTFNGVLENAYEMSGATRLDGEYHIVNMTIDMDVLTFDFTYDNASKSYQMIVLNGDETQLNITFEITYDAFDIPMLTMTYTRDELDVSLQIKKSFRIGGFTIDYVIDDEDTFEGHARLLYLMMLRQYRVFVTDSDGTEYDYTFDRPSVFTNYQM